MKRMLALITACAVSVILLGLAACHENHPKPLQVLVLVDMSASIEPEAQTAAFDSIERFVATLHRGDSLVVIPIMGDAENESQGRILRFALPERREVYDQDRRRITTEVRRALEAMKSEAVSKPGSHTDVLGALRLATEEMRAASADKNKMIVVFSDFIQDDRQFNFTKTPAIESRASAQNLAIKLSRETDLHMNGIPIFLGMLRSKDLDRLKHERRLAIQEFWKQYLVSSGAKPTLAVDGPGLVSGFLAERQ